MRPGTTGEWGQRSICCMAGTPKANSSPSLPPTQRRWKLSRHHYKCLLSSCGHRTSSLRTWGTCAVQTTPITSSSLSPCMLEITNVQNSDISDPSIHPIYKFHTQEAVRRQPDQVFAFNHSISYWWRLDWHKYQPDIPPGSILMWTAPWSSTSSPLTSRSQQWSVCLFLRWPGWQSNALQWWCWCRCVKWRSPPSPSLPRCSICLQLKTKTWIES